MCWVSAETNLDAKNNFKMCVSKFGVRNKYKFDVCARQWLHRIVQSKCFE